MSVKNPIFWFFHEKLHACLVFMYENQNKIEKCSDFEKNLFFQLPGEKKNVLDGQEKSNFQNFSNKFCKSFEDVKNC